MAGTGLDKAFADADAFEAAYKGIASRVTPASERYVTGIKAATAAADIGRQLETTSNWTSRTSVAVARHLEEYRHYVDWVYVAVKAIAQRIAGQPVRVARPKKPGRRGMKAFNERMASKAFLDGLEPLDQHPFLDAIHAPNPVMVCQSLVFSTVASMEITGESHWWFSEGADGKTQIWPLPSHWVQPADNLRSAWKIRPWYSSTEWNVPAESIAYFNFPDPACPFWAKSPLSSQAAAVNADESLQVAQEKAFANGITPKLAVRIGNPLDGSKDAPIPQLDRDQRTAILDAIMDRWGGAGKAGLPIILDALVRDVFPISRTPAEMDFLQSGKATKSRIFQAYGVNPLIVGEIEGANRAQAVVAEQSFITNVINPIIELLSQVLTRWVAPAFASEGEGLVAWFEPARANDPEMTLKEWELGLKFGTVSANEHREALGLGPVPGGEVRLVPATMLPAADA